MDNYEKAMKRLYDDHTKATDFLNSLPRESHIIAGIVTVLIYGFIFYCIITGVK